MRTTIVALYVSLLGTVLCAGPPNLRGQTTAPIGSRLVEVAVSVRDGSRAVSGLSAADFVLSDNDVVQTVQVVRADAVPADVTLIIDTKSSITGLADRFVKDLQQIARSLPTDARMRLLRIDTFVEELRPMSSAAGQVSIAPWPQIGWSSLHDAMIAALVSRANAGRPHLIVVVTDGADTMSVTTSDRVREIASRSDALMQIVTVRPPGGSSGQTTTLRPRFRDSNLLVLAEAAEQTGGELRGPGLFGDTDLTTAVTRVVEEFRRSYILRYTPTNVEIDGWHDVSITVPRSPNATVRARRGYHVG